MSSRGGGSGDRRTQARASQRLMTAEVRDMCGEEELFRQVHTLFGRNAQVVYELHVQEDIEEECGRKCV